MKKLLYFILAISGLFIFTSCGGNGSADMTTNDSSSNEAMKLEIEFIADGVSLDVVKVNSGDIFDISTIANPTKAGYTFKGWDYDFNNPILKDVATNAIFDANRYTISYDDGSVKELEVLFDSSYKLPSPTRAGYSFIGYYYNDKEFPLEGKYNIPSNITLSLKWAKEFNDINYNLPEGIENPNPKVVAKDKPITLLPIENEAYKFEGWFSDKKLTMPVAELTFIDGGEDINVYPKISKYKEITYVLNGGVNNALNPKYIKDNVALLPATMENAGFRGWYLEPDFKTLVTKIDASSSDVTLYACFDTRKYKITLDYGDEDIVLEAYYNEKFTLTAKDKVGYTFSHYKYNDTGLKLGENIFNYDSDITLTPVYTPNTYRINYVLDGGSAINAPKSFTYGKELALPKASKEGYKFIAYHVGTIDGEVFDNVFDMAQDLTLVAEYEIINYSITYNLNGGTIDGTPKATYNILDVFNFDAPTKPGYNFNWYLSDGERISGVNHNTGDIVLEAVYVPKVFEVYLYLMDNTKLINVKYNEEIVIPEVDVEGYTIEGYYYNNKKLVDFTYTYLENISIVCNYTPIEYKINYNLNGGTNDPSNPTTYNIEDPDIKIMPAFKEGYKFIKWRGLSSNDTIYSHSTGDLNIEAVYEVLSLNVATYSNDVYTGTTTLTHGEAVDLTKFSKKGYNLASAMLNGVALEDTYVLKQENNILALTYEVINYNITYVLNGGRLHADSPLTINVEDYPNLLPAYKDGVGACTWYTNKEFNYEFNYDYFKNDPRDITLYAKYDARYKMTIKPNLAELQIRYYSYEPNQAIVLDDIAYEGYNFLGYTYNGEPFTPDVYSYNSDIEISANYERITYNVTYDYGIGSDSGNILSYDVRAVYRLVDPITPDGYKFLGWFDGDIRVFSLNDMARDLSLVAKYELIKYQIEYFGVGTDTNPNPTEYDINGLRLEPIARKGYTFLGFFIKDTEDKVEVLDGSLKDVKLQARFKINTYKVTINHGDGYLEVLDVEFNDRINGSNEFRLGYTVIGYTYNGEPFNVLSVDSDIEIMADLKLKEYAIRYLDLSDEEKKGLPMTYNIESSFKLVAPVREGFRFNGYTIDNRLITEITKGMTGNLDLSCNFMKPVYTVSISLNNGTPEYKLYIYDAEVREFIVEIPKKPGYHFDFWQTTGCEKIDNTHFYINENSDASISAVYEADNYSIKFVGHNDPAIVDFMASYSDIVRLPIPSVVPEGKIFAYWHSGNGNRYDEYQVFGSATFQAVFINAGSELSYDLDSNPDGAIITGINIVRDKLYIPDEVNGKRVIGISGQFDVYDKIAGFKEISFGINIKTLPAGLLRSASLSKLEFRGSYKEKADLFEGVCKIDTLAIPSGFDIMSLFNNKLPDGLNIELLDSVNGYSSLEGIDINRLTLPEGTIDLNLDLIPFTFNELGLPNSLNLIKSTKALNISLINLKSLDTWFNLTNNLTLGSNYLLALNDELISELIVPEGITIIKENALRGAQITKLIVHDNVTEIKANAFIDSSLQIMELGSGVNKIGENVINNVIDIIYNGTEESYLLINIASNNPLLKNIKPLYTPMESMEYSNADYSFTLVNNRYIYDFKVLNNNLKSIDLVSGFDGFTLVTLAKDAFSLSLSLDYVLLPDTLLSANGSRIDPNTRVIFSGSSRLWNSNDKLNSLSDNVYFAPNIKSIEYLENDSFNYFVLNNEYVIIRKGFDTARVVDLGKAFSGMRVVSIMQSAFKYSFVEEVILPDGIVEIGDHAFYYSKLNRINLPDGLSYIGKQAFYNAYLNEVAIPGSVKVISKEAFARNPLTKVILAEGILEIGHSAFMNTEELRTINFPDSLVKLNEKSFYGSGLEYARIPDGTIDLPDGAFDYCSNIKVLDIPSSLVSLNFFRGSDNLLRVNVDTFMHWSKIKFADDIYESSKNVGIYNSEGVLFDEITIGETIGETIRTQYRYYNKLRVVNIINPVTIDAECFMGCKGIEILNVGSLEDYLACSFKYKDDNPLVCGNGHLYIDGVRVDDLVIPASCKAINPNLFSGHSFNTVTIENGVEEIATGAFSGSSIRSITLPESILKLGSYAFSYSHLEEITLPTHLVEIDSGVFLGTKSLRKVVFNSELLRIKDRAFSESGIKELILPDSVKFVDNSAFDLSSLDLIELGSEYDGDNNGVFTNPDFTAKVLRVRDTNTKYTSKDLTGNELNIIAAYNLSEVYSLGEVAYVPAGAKVLSKGNYKLTYYLGNPSDIEAIFTAQFRKKNYIEAAEVIKNPTYVDDINYSYILVGNDVYSFYLKDNNKLKLDFNEYLPEYNIRTIDNASLQNRSLEDVALPKGLRMINIDLSRHTYLDYLRFTNTIPLMSSYVALHYADVDFINSDVLFRSEIELDGYYYNDLLINGSKPAIVKVPLDVSVVPDGRISKLNVTNVALHSGVTSYYGHSMNNIYYDGTEESLNNVLRTSAKNKYFNIAYDSVSVVDNDDFSYITIGNEIYKFKIKNKTAAFDLTTMLKGYTIKEFAENTYNDQNILIYDLNTFDLKDNNVTQQVRNYRKPIIKATMDEFEAKFGFRITDATYTGSGMANLCDTNGYKYIELDNEIYYLELNDVLNNYIDLRAFNKTISKIVINDSKLKYIIMPAYKIAVKSNIDRNEHFYVMSELEKYETNRNFDSNHTNVDYVGCIKGNSELVDGSDIKYIKTDDMVFILESTNPNLEVLDLINIEPNHKVNGIAKNAFMNHLGLRKIIFDDVILELGDNAFKGCSNLDEIVNPNNAKLDNLSFDQNHKLKSLTAGERYLYGNSLFDLSELRELHINESYYAEHYYVMDKLERLTVDKFAKLYVSAKNLKYLEGTLNTLEYVLSRPNKVSELVIIDTARFDDYNSLYTNDLEVIRYVDYNSHSYPPTLYLPFGPKVKVFTGNIEYKVDSNTLNYLPNLKYLFNPEFRSYRAYNEDVTELFNIEYESLVDLSNDKFTYTLINDKYVIINSILDKNIVNLDLTKEFSGYTIYKLGNDLFNGCSNLEAVVLPTGLKQIGYRAFKDCSKLSSVVFNDGLELIMNDAFVGCPLLESINIKSDKLVIHEAFTNSNLVDIKLLGSSIRVNDSFLGSHKVKRLEWPSGIGAARINSMDIEYIKGGIGAFGDESTRLYLKEAYVTEASASLLRNYINLRRVEVAEGIEVIPYDMFAGCSNLLEVVLPSTIKRIEAGAFKYCKSLKTINIPDSSVDIESNAFLGCEALESFTFPTGTKNISENVLRDCKSLANVVIPEGVEVIMGSAFSNTNLRGATLPKSLVRIDSYAFDDCKNLDYINVLGNTSVYDIEPNLRALIIFNSGSEYSEGILKNNCLIEGDKASINTSGIISDYSSRILIENYKVNKIEVVNKDKYTYTLINDELVYNLEAIEGFNEYNLAQDFKGLKVLSFKNTGTNFKDAEILHLPLDMYLFNNLAIMTTSLKEVHISSLAGYLSMKDQDYPFLGNGIKLYVNGVVAKRVTLPDLNMELKLDYFTNNETIEELVIPGSYKRLLKGFSNMPNLKSVVLNEGVEYIGRDAFKDSENLRELSLPESLLEIEDSSFNSSKLGFVKIPSSWEEINNTGLYNLILSKNIRIIRMNIINNLIYEGSSEELELVSGMPYNVNTHVNIKCSSAKYVNDGLFSYILADDINIYELRLKKYAPFDGDLVTYFEGYVIKSIASYGFKQYNSDKLVLPEGVEAIGEEAFGSSMIKEIYLPSTLRVVESRAFNIESFNKLVVAEGGSFTSGENNDMLYDKANKVLYAARNNFLIPMDCLEIASYACQRQRNGTFLPRGVKKIGRDGIQGKIYYEGTEDEFNQYGLSIYSFDSLSFNISLEDFMNKNK